MNHVASLAKGILMWEEERILFQKKKLLFNLRTGSYAPMHYTFHRQILWYSYFEKVVWKNVHVTIPKIIWSVHCSWHFSCGAYFWCFHSALTNIPAILSNLCFTHDTFWDCRVHFIRQPFSKFTIFTYTTMHLVHPPPPQKKKNCITIVFDIGWDDCNTQEKLETMVMQNLGGGGWCKQGTLWSMWKWCIAICRERTQKLDLKKLLMLYQSFIRLSWHYEKENRSLDTIFFAKQDVITCFQSIWSQKMRALFLSVI